MPGENPPLAPRSGSGAGTGDGGARGPRVAAPAGAWDGKTTPVDARAKDASGDEERVVGRMLDEGGARERGVSREVVVERFRSAAEGAERAIEQQSVPNQHADLVRRVFGRYLERVKKSPAEAGSGPAPSAVTDSKDAEKK